MGWLAQGQRGVDSVDPRAQHGQPDVGARAVRRVHVLAVRAERLRRAQVRLRAHLHGAADARLQLPAHEHRLPRHQGDGYPSVARSC